MDEIAPYALHHRLRQAYPDVPKALMDRVILLAQAVNEVGYDGLIAGRRGVDVLASFPSNLLYPVFDVLQHMPDVPAVSVIER